MLETLQQVLALGRSLEPYEHIPSAASSGLRALSALLRLVASPSRGPVEK